MKVKLPEMHSDLGIYLYISGLLIWQLEAVFITRLYALTRPYYIYMLVEQMNYFPC